MIAYEDRDFGLAIQWMQRARDLKPDDEGTLANLANSYSRHGMLAEALHIMEQMQQLSPLVHVCVMLTPLGRGDTL